MWAYNGFTEIDGTFVPVPGLCHPALIDIAATVRDNDQDSIVLPIAPLITAMSLHPSSLTPNPQFAYLEFTRSRVIGSRWDGVDIEWDVWVDQYGRAISSTSYLVTNV